MPRPNTNSYYELYDVFVIRTNKGENILVDADDFDFLKQFSWYVSTRGYAYTRINGKCVSMHRLLMGSPKGLQIDHINRRKTDNRKCNLRMVSNIENHHNLGLNKSNKSGYTGVHRHSTCDRWVAQITVNGQTIHGGLFENLDDAVARRKELEDLYWRNDTSV